MTHNEILKEISFLEFNLSLYEQAKNTKEANKTREKIEALKDMLDTIEEGEAPGVPPMAPGKTPGDFVQFPLISHKDIITDKSCPYNVYATLMINSNFNPSEVGENYIYKNKMGDVMVFLEGLKQDFPNGKIPAQKTVEKHIKALLKYDIPLLTVENTPHGLAYKIKTQIDNKYFVRIPYIQIRELLASTNGNMLKLYVILCVQCDTENYKVMDRKFLCRQLGLSDKADNTIKTIGTMLQSLHKLGFIEIHEEVIQYLDENKKIITKSVHSYRLRTVEEYKEAGKIKKVKRTTIEKLEG